MATLAAARMLVEEVTREQPQVVALARLTSFAVRVDPPLLRRLRLELLPESSPALEADLWNGSLVTFRGPEGFVFAPGVATVLREQLAALGNERYEQAWLVTRESHQWLSPALCLEEELNYLQSSQTPEAYARARELLRSAVAEIVREESPGLAHWAVGASTRLPSDLMDMEEGRMLAMAARTRLPGSLLQPSPPSGQVPEWMTWLAPEGLERTRLGVRMFPSYVELGPARKSDEAVIELPRTSPLVVEVAEADWSNPPTVRPRRIFISYGLSDQSVLWWYHFIRESLRKSSHRVLPGYGDLQPGMSWRESINEWIDQSDAAIVLLSEASFESRSLMAELHRLFERQRKERGDFTLVGAYVLPEDSSGRPPLSQVPAALSSLAWIEARHRNSQQVLRQLLEALGDSRQAATPWRRLELRAPGPVRIPLMSDVLRLRTLLGDEYVIEPARPAELLQVPRPLKGPVAHPRELQALLQEVDRGAPILAISGAAGMGKTQLVRQLFERAEHAFPDGRFYLGDLQSGPPMSARAIAWMVVQVAAPEQAWASDDPLRLYHSLLSERRMALVLEDVDSWRWSTPDVASELNALHPTGDRGSLLVVTAGRPIKDLDARWMELAPLDASAAVGLLLRLAPQAIDHAPEIADACRYLATPLREVGLALSRLPSGIPVERYILLLRQAHLLGVFPESFDLRAAEVVLVGDEGASKEGERLMAQEMLQAGLLQVAGPGRYALWWPVRQVAETRWAEPEPYVASWRHAGYFLNLLERLHEQYTQRGPARAEAIATFDVESVNITTALEWLLTRLTATDETGLAQRVVPSLSTTAPTLLRLRRPPHERERWFEHTNKALGSKNPFLLLEYALAQAELGRAGQALETCDHARDLVAFPSADAAEEDIVVKLARLYLEWGDQVAAREMLQELHEQGMSSRARGAESHYIAARLAFLEGRWVEVEQELLTSRSLAASEGDIRLEVEVLMGLASVAAQRDELGRSAALYEEALEFARSWRDDRGAALTSWELGLIRARQGIFERAEELLRVLVDYRRSIGHFRAEATAQEMEKLLRSWGIRAEASEVRAERRIQLRLELDAESGTVHAASFSPDGRLVICAAGTSALVWDLGSGEPLARTRTPGEEMLAAGFSPDGMFIVTAGEAGSVVIREASSNRERRQLIDHEDSVYAANFSPDGRLVVTASGDGSAILWDARSGRILRKLIDHIGAVYAASFSPDGLFIVTAGEDRTVNLWNTSSGNLRYSLKGHERAIHAASFSPDGRHLVTAGVDSAVLLWDVTSGSLLGRMHHNEAAVYAASFSPDGRHLVTAGGDATVLIWEVAAQRVVQEVSGHAETVYAASFSPEGRRLLTAGLDGVVRIWDVSTVLSPSVD